MSTVATDLRVWRGFVPGHPAPKGSIVQWRDERGVPHSRESSHRVKPWVKAVHEIAQYSRPRPEPLQGPIGVRLIFRIPRPKTNRDPFPMDVMKGDLDKLCRAALDGMNGPIFRDDGEVVQLTAVKVFATTTKPAGVTIVAWEIAESEWDRMNA